MKKLIKIDFKYKNQFLVESFESKKNEIKYYIEIVPLKGKKF